MRWVRKYLKVFELGFQTALEYRANFALSLLSAAYPIIIQTYLWTAIYTNSTQAVVYGYTYRQMIAYTFLAGLASRIVRTGFEYDIMDDVKSGKFSKFQVQPLGYFAYRLCAFLGQKLPKPGDDSGRHGHRAGRSQRLLGRNAGALRHPVIPADVDAGGRPELPDLLLFQRHVILDYRDRLPV